MRTLLLVSLTTLLSLGLTGCSSKHKAKDIETELEKKDRMGTANVGVKDGKMIVQDKRLLAEELRKLQVDVYELEDKVYGNEKTGSLGLYGVLKDCRKKLSSKRYGGSGKLMWTERLDRVTLHEDDLKVGIDENKELVAVKEEYILDRIDRFKKYRKILRLRDVEMQDKVDICKAELDSRKHETQTKN